MNLQRLIAEFKAKNEKPIISEPIVSEPIISEPIVPATPPEGQYTYSSQ